MRERVRFGSRKEWVVLTQSGGRNVEMLWLKGAEVPMTERRREAELMDVGLIEDVALLKNLDVENPWEGGIVNP